MGHEKQSLVWTHVCWTESFLSASTEELELEGKQKRGEKTNKGITLGHQRPSNSNMGKDMHRRWKRKSKKTVCRAHSKDSRRHLSH